MNWNIRTCCCFFGHQKLVITDTLKNTLKMNIEQLITEKQVDSFLFGCNSDFDNLCYQVVTELKGIHSNIKRIYIRAKFPDISDSYLTYLLQYYEDTYYPPRLIHAGRAVYVERNYELIDKSSHCIIYYNENYVPQCRKNTIQNRKSGTKIAYEYAKKRNIQIINVFESQQYSGRL